MTELIIAMGQFAPLYIEFFRKGVDINMKKLYEFIFKGLELITPRADV